MTSKAKGQGNKVMPLVWWLFARNSTTKIDRNANIGKKVVGATTDVPREFQTQKVKCQGH